MRREEKRREEMARSPAGSAAHEIQKIQEIAAIEARIALARRLLDGEQPDEAALALDGLLWRMAELVDYARGEARGHAQMVMRLRLAARAPNVEARLVHYAALAHDLQEKRHAERVQVCPARRPGMRSRRQGRGDRYDGYRESA